MDKRKTIIVTSAVLIIVFLIGGYFLLTKKFLVKKHIPSESSLGPSLNIPSFQPSTEEGKIVIQPYTTKPTRPDVVIKIEKPKERIKVFPSKVKCELPKNPPEGKIYLTLKPVKGGNLGLYYFDVKEKKIGNFLVDEYNNWFLDFSDDGEKIVFLSDRAGGYPQIFVSDKNGKNIKQITKTKYNETGDRWKPVFTPDGQRIFYMFWPRVFGQLAESLFIYSTDLEGNEQFFDKGSSFAFIPKTNKLLISKNAGIYLIDFDKREIDKAIELRNETEELILGDVNMTKMNISPDGKYLSFSNLTRNEFYVFEIVSLDPFVPELRTIMNKIGFWSAFSPDGKYLAIQEAEGFDKNGKPVNPKLVIYDTCKFNKVLEYPLNEYSGGDMWINDWR